MFLFLKSHKLFNSPSLTAQKIRFLLYQTQRTITTWKNLVQFFWKASFFFDARVHHNSWMNANYRVSVEKTQPCNRTRCAAGLHSPWLIFNLRMCSRKFRKVRVSRSKRRNDASSTALALAASRWPHWTLQLCQSLSPTLLAFRQSAHSRRRLLLATIEI